MKIIERFCDQHNELREPRQGVMLHYDESTGDEGGLQWFFDPACDVSYDFWISRKGLIYRLVPPGRRAWHAGNCRPARGYNYQDANSAFVGVSIAAAHTWERATPAQLAAVVELCSSLGANNSWPLDNPVWITGHNVQAWPRGRKSDPEGYNPARPVMSVAEVRAAVSRGAKA